MTAADDQHVRIERSTDGIVHLVIDRQDKLNAMTVAMRARIGRLLSELGRDAAVRVIVIRGVGGRAFSAGGDVAEFLTLKPHQLLRWGEEFTLAEQAPQPVIAAIDGHCLGAGLELALACDFRLATTRSVLGLPEVRLGMMPGSGGTQRLVRLVGLARAKQMIMRGQRVSAAEAAAYGLVNEVVEPGALDDAVQALARELSGYSASSLAAVKQVLNRALDGSLETGMEMERKAYGMLRSTHDYVEGIRAFLDRRPPSFIGE